MVSALSQPKRNWFAHVLLAWQDTGDTFVSKGGQRVLRERQECRTMKSASWSCARPMFATQTKLLLLLPARAALVEKIAMPYRLTGVWHTAPGRRAGCQRPIRKPNSTSGSSGEVRC
jgi:hypothetical protein